MAPGSLRKGVFVQVHVHLTALLTPAAAAELADRHLERKKKWRRRIVMKRKKKRGKRERRKIRREERKRVQMLALHVYCSDQEQLPDAACHSWPQQQFVHTWLPMMVTL